MFDSLILNEKQRFQKHVPCIPEKHRSKTNAKTRTAQPIAYFELWLTTSSPSSCFINSGLLSGVMITILLRPNLCRGSKRHDKNDGGDDGNGGNMRLVDLRDVVEKNAAALYTNAKCSPTRRSKALLIFLTI